VTFPFSKDCILWFEITCLHSHQLWIGGTLH